MTKEQENYLKALHDLKEAKKSFDELTDLQKRRLIEEVLGVEFVQRLGFK